MVPIFCLFVKVAYLYSSYKEVIGILNVFFVICFIMDLPHALLSVNICHTTSQGILENGCKLKRGPN